MNFKSFTPEDAAESKISLVLEENKGNQAVHDSIVALQVNRRAGTACAKNRSEVSGSGKKLWRQKGTGRARMGSVRSPIWVGGGVVFGPRPRDYEKKVNKKVRRLAFRKVLTDRIKNGDVYFVEAFQIADGKTKTFQNTLNTITTNKKILIIGGRFDDLTFRSARNVGPVLLMSGQEVNIEHLMRCDKIILTSDAIQALSNRTV